MGESSEAEVPQPQIAYVRVWELASEFATGFTAVHLGPSWAVVEVLGQTGDLIDELSPITEPLPADSGPGTPISNQPIDVLYALLQQRADIVATATAEQVHGFSAFSEDELGVEGVDMIAAFARPFLPVYKAFATLDADPVVVAKISDAYREVWRLRLQRQPIR